MTRFSCFGVQYGIASDDGGGLGVCVQEAHNKNGRLIALRTCMTDADGEPRRYAGSSYVIRPELLPSLIAALQAAKRHTDALMVVEQVAFCPAAFTEEGSGNG